MNVILALLTLLANDIKTGREDLIFSHKFSCDLQAEAEKINETPGSWSKLTRLADPHEVALDADLTEEDEEYLHMAYENWDTAKCTK